MCLESCFKKFPNLKEYNVYIDGSNVAYSRFNQFKKPILSDILLVFNHLIEELGFKKEKIYCICDPSLKYNIDKLNEYEALLRERLIIESPKIADEFILSFTLKHDFCFIISNDKFRNYLDQLPSKQWLIERRISFMIINNEVCLSPTSDYEKFLTKENFYLKKIEQSFETTTLDILNRIDESEGELDLF